MTSGRCRQLSLRTGPCWVNRTVRGWLFCFLLLWQSVTLGVHLMGWKKTDHFFFKLHLGIIWFVGFFCIYFHWTFGFFSWIVMAFWIFWKLSFKVYCIVSSACLCVCIIQNGSMFGFTVMLSCCFLMISCFFFFFYEDSYL